MSDMFTPQLIHGDNSGIPLNIGDVVMFEFVSKFGCLPRRGRIVSFVKENRIKIKSPLGFGGGYDVNDLTDPVTLRWKMFYRDCTSVFWVGSETDPINCE
jgi:hypothetical protein